MAELRNHLTIQLAALTPAAQGLAVALSGGADSWALTLLTHDYCRQDNIPFIALTVDHGLRPESAAEAATVAAACAARGIPQQTLVWQHEGITTRKQERARAARYDLLGAYCQTHGFTHLLTAHHADDQAETVLLRFAKGSGSKGLAGMAASRTLPNGVTLLRPWLSIPKANLIAYADAAGVPVMADPSNANPAYARARLREAQAVLAREGLTTATLLKTAAAAAAEDEALAYATHEFLWAKVSLTPDRIEFPLDIWNAVPAELKRRAFIAAWQWIKPKTAPYPPERAAILAAFGGLLKPGDKRTLGGLIMERKTADISLQREHTGRPKPTIVS